MTCMSYVSPSQCPHGVPNSSEIQERGSLRANCSSYPVKKLRMDSCITLGLYGGPGGREQTLHTCGFCALHVGRFCGYTLTTNTGFGFKRITKGDLRVLTLNIRCKTKGGLRVRT